MAAELSYILPGTPVTHQPHHDLESFFYILVGICLLYETPYVTKPPKKLAECFDPLFATAQPSLVKTFTIQSEFGWTAIILPNISPYFRPLVPLLSDLREKMILPLRVKDGVVQTPQDFTHREFIIRMVKTLALLSDNSWKPHSNEGVEQSRSPSGEASIPSPFDTTRFLSEETLLHPTQIRMPGTSSGSACFKRPLDSADYGSNPPRKKRSTQSSSQPVGAA